MATSTPPQQTAGIPRVRPVYEDFRPNSEWKQEDQSHDQLLLVYLPGFFKEQLKVSTEGTDILRIRGERLVGDNKWSRFQEDFRIPQDCNIKGIRAKFESETLTITMPKKIMMSTIVPKELQPETTQKIGAPDSTTDIPAPTPQLTSDAKGVVGDNKSVQPPSPSATKYPKGRDEGKQADDHKLLQESKPQKAATEPKSTPLKVTPPSTAGVEKQPDGKGVGLTTAANIVRETTEREERSQTKQSRMPTELKLPAKDNVDAVKPKQNTDGSSGVGGAGTGFELGKYRQQPVKRLAKGDLNKESRQLMVNMGVAVLVIVALGAYISYTLGSSGKTK